MIHIDSDDWYNDPHAYVVPYNGQKGPMYGRSLQLLIRRCVDSGKWDRTRKETFVLDNETNTDCHIEYHLKNIGNDEELRYTKYFMEHENVYNTYNLRNKKTGGSSSGRYSLESKKIPYDYDKYGQIHDFLQHRALTKSQLPIYDQIFDVDCKFAKIVTDESFGVEIKDNVSFGDFGDVQSTKSQMTTVTGTIYGFINTVRTFVAGKYRFTMIYPFCTEQNEPFCVFHHSSVSPTRLVRKILTFTDYDTFHYDIVNSINRYDWCHYRNWHSGDNNSFGQTIFFTQTDHADKMKNLLSQSDSDSVEKSKIIDVLSQIHKGDDTVGLAIDMGKVAKDDWLFGKLFKDPICKKYYALVVNGYISELYYQPVSRNIIKKFGKQNFTSIEETRLEIIMNQFCDDNGQTEYNEKLNYIFNTYYKENMLFKLFYEIMNDCKLYIDVKTQTNRKLTYLHSKMEKLYLKEKNFDFQVDMKRCFYLGCTTCNAKFLCKKCKKVRYCSRKCQKRDWVANHREDCCNDM